MQIHDPQLSVRRIVETSGFPYVVMRHEARETIYSQGDLSDSVMYVESGRVELIALSASGKQATCGLAGAGTFFGEDVLAGGAARSHSAAALTATTVLSFSKPAMTGMLATQPAFARRFIEHCVHSATRLREDLAGQLLYSCEARLARVLLALAEAEEGAGLTHDLPNVTQEFMARLVGTTRSRVNHFLGRFKRIGFVEERRGGLRINPAMLGAIPGLGNTLLLGRSERPLMPAGVNDGGARA